MKNQQEKAQYVELVKSIFINLEKIDRAIQLFATKFAFNTCKVIESQAFTIPELQKLLELTKIALLCCLIIQFLWRTSITLGVVLTI